MVLPCYIDNIRDRFISVIKYRIAESVKISHCSPDAFEAERPKP